MYVGRIIILFAFGILFVAFSALFSTINATHVWPVHWAMAQFGLRVMPLLHVSNIINNN